MSDGSEFHTVGAATLQQIIVTIRTARVVLLSVVSVCVFVCLEPGEAL